MADRRPTRRQLRVLRAVQRLTVRLQFAPTLRELADELGISSTNGVADHLYRLKLRGLVDWVPGRARTLVFTHEGLAVLELSSQRRAAA